MSARANDFFMHHTIKSCGSLLEAVEQITAQSVLLDDPASAPEKIARALAVCQEASLPVYIELPADVVNQKIEAHKASSAVLPVNAKNLQKAAETILQRVAAAKKPVIMAGVESERFNELVDWSYTKLADLWSGKGYRCTNCDQLYRALQDAQKQEFFTLLEVVTERDELSEKLMAWISEQKGEE